jgi:glc operon protein GlcG
MKTNRATQFPARASASASSGAQRLASAAALAFVATLAAAAALAGGAATAEPAGSMATQQKKVLSLSGAKAVGEAAEVEARRLDTTGAIAVVDDGGHLLYLSRLDNTFPSASAISIEKARSAAVFRRPTAIFEDAIKGGRASLLANRELLPLQGGVPILVDGQVVGAVGVSGAASAQQDEEIAKVAARALGGN